MTTHLVTTQWAAKALGVHSSTISRLVDRGDLSPQHRGTGSRGAMLFDQAEVIRLATTRAAA